MTVLPKRRTHGKNDPHQRYWGLSTDSAIITDEAEVDNEYSNGIKRGVSTYLDNIIKKSIPNTNTLLKVDAHS